MVEAGENDMALAAAVVADEWYVRRSADDLELFARGLVIPAAHGDVLFDDCIVPFQEEFFRAVAPSLSALRTGDVPPCRRFWVERTKKSAKDSDVAICLLWLMAFPKRPLLVQVSAANQEQADIIRTRAKDILFHNPWLRDLVRIQNYRIIGRDGVGEVKIEATGKGGSKQGPTPHLLILNELVHVENWSVNQAHLNNADGVPRGVVIVCTNAGFKGTEAEMLRKVALANPRRWMMLLWQGSSPWLNEEDIEAARQQDPIGMEFKRLFLGKWISASGGAVSDEEIERCFTRKQPDGTRRPRMRGPHERARPGWDYVAGLDLGVSKDHAGLAVLGVNAAKRRIAVAMVRGWAPTMLTTEGKREVDGRDVKRVCLRAHRIFHFVQFGYDPQAGGSFMAQEFGLQGVPVMAMSFSSPKNLDMMAQSFVACLKSGILVCYEDEEGRLRRDFAKFEIVDRGMRGCRLEATADEYGHADVGTGVLIALPKAVALLGGFGGLEDGDVLMDDGSEEPPKRKRGEGDDFDDLYDTYDSLDREFGRG